jgi:protein-S-isoprenylcysteine O-methyltransferase Ste14
LALTPSTLDGEEALMLDVFGEQYASYMTRIGRLLPRLRQPDE